jgi:hypothetical protein
MIVVVVMLRIVAMVMTVIVTVTRGVRVVPVWVSVGRWNGCAPKRLFGQVGRGHPALLSAHWTFLQLTKANGA